YPSPISCMTLPSELISSRFPAAPNQNRIERTPNDEGTFSRLCIHMALRADLCAGDRNRSGSCSECNSRADSGAVAQCYADPVSDADAGQLVGRSDVEAFRLA